MKRPPRTALSPRGVFEASITEEHVFSACRALLELNGARVHRITERIPWGPKGRKSEPGIPDSFGWFPAKRIEKKLVEARLWFNVAMPMATHFYIEFKKPGGRRRQAQELWITQAREDGVIAFFADSVEAMAAGFAEYGIQLKGLR